MNGIHEVSGSIPLSSTRRQTKAGLSSLFCFFFIANRTASDLKPIIQLPQFFKEMPFPQDGFCLWTSCLDPSYCGIHQGILSFGRIVEGSAVPHCIFLPGEIFMLARYSKRWKYKKS